MAAKTRHIFLPRYSFNLEKRDELKMIASRAAHEAALFMGDDLAEQVRQGKRLWRAAITYLIDIWRLNR